MVLGVIPARHASTRLPAKPLIDLLGRPMIRHVYERAKQSALLTHVIVATDHEAIADAVRTFGGEVALTPADLPTGSDRVAHVAARYPGASIIVNIQGDEPLMAPGMIDLAVKPLLEDRSIDAGTLIRRLDRKEDLTNPAVVKVVIDSGGFAIYFSRSPIPYLREGGDTSRWHDRHTYYKHIGLYAYRRELLLQFAAWGESPLERAEKLEQLRIIEHGYRIKATLTAEDTVPVDTAADADAVRAILRDRQKENAA